MAVYRGIEVTSRKEATCFWRNEFLPLWFIENSSTQIELRFEIGPEIICE